MRTLLLLSCLWLSPTAFASDHASSVKITKVVGPLGGRAIGINDHSDVLYVDPKTRELSIDRHGKLTDLHQQCAFWWGAVNNRGDVLFNRLGDNKVCLLHDGHVQEIRSPLAQEFDALSINDRGDVLVNGIRGVSILHGGNLRLLIPSKSNCQFDARAINNNGDIVGVDFTQSIQGPRIRPVEHACIFSHGKVTDLKGRPGVLYIAFAISNDDIIVGQSRTNDPQTESAVIWPSPTLPPIDLNEVLPKGCKLKFSGADAINSRHQIVATGINGANRKSFLVSIMLKAVNAR